MKTIIALLLLGVTVHGSEKFPFPEKSLQRVEERYDDAPLDLAKPLYRCGEIVRVEGNTGQIAIIQDHQFEKNQWFYRLIRAHFEGSN